MLLPEDRVYKRVGLTQARDEKHSYYED